MAIKASHKPVAQVSLRRSKKTGKMTHPDLIRRFGHALKACRVPESEYFIGGYCEGRTCLEVNERGTASVYFAERGQKIGEKEFLDQSEACRELVSRLRVNKLSKMRIAIKVRSAEK